MGIIKKVWEKTRFAREAEEKKKQKELEDEVRAEIQDEIRQEVKSELKKKILKEEKDKINGVKDPNKTSFLEKLGKEFAGSSVGSSDQLNKLMGKDTNTSVANSSTPNSGLSNKNILEALGSKNVSNNNSNSKLIGDKFNFNRNTEDLIGLCGSTTGKNLDSVSLMGHKSSQTGKQVDMTELIGLKKKK